MSDEPRNPPADLEAEEILLGCCLRDGASTDAAGKLTWPTLTRCAEAGLSTTDFYSAENALIFSTLLDERRAGKPIDFQGLMLDLMESGRLEGTDLSARAIRIDAAAPTTLHAGHVLAKVLEKSARRRFISGATRLVEESYNGTEFPDLLETARDLIAPITSAAPTKTDAVRILESHRVTQASAPAEPVTRLFLAGKPIATSGNLVTLISKAKTGKTATTGATTAAMMAASSGRTDVDTLGFTSPKPTGAVIVIDTEQSPYDAYVCYQRAMARAEQVQDPAWLRHYALVGQGAAALKDSLLLACEEGRKAHGAIWQIILDGVADFVLSVNDEAECNDFVSWLRSLAVTNDCPIICVIHSNEAVKAGDDGRGHLGKQLTRKAESNLLLKKSGEVTMITSEKQRKAPITEDDGIAFRWSDQEKRHVSCRTVQNVKDSAQTDKMRDMAQAVFEHLGKPAARYSDVVKAITEVRGVSSSRAEDRFTEMKKRGLLARDLIGCWRLAG